MKSRTILDMATIRSIIDKCDVGYLGMMDENGKPYVIPLNFGFAGDTIFLHGSPKGKKISLLRKNPSVCIAFSTDHLLRYRDADVACSWSMKYRSVLVHGRVEFIDDYEERTKAMNIIMKKYAGHEFSFRPPSINNVQPFKIVEARFECRVYGY
jgi:nitroimidazol reductase NimA-like FMN-containing flavoprotein (pyridoxamine 5'-phosphate oxidase superfamily)